MTAGILASLAVLFWLQIESARIGDRWRPGLINVILHRVLPNPSVLNDWRRRYEIPSDERLIELAGKWSFSDNWAAYKHKGFQRWLTKRGRRSYAHFALTHPGKHGDDKRQHFSQAGKATHENLH